MNVNKYIFLGSFNPPHNGHVACIKSLVDNCKDIEIAYVIPAWQNPNKSASIEFAHRYNMTRIAFEGIANVVVSEIENVVKPKNTYELFSYIKENLFHTFKWVITEETLLEIIDGKWANSDKLLEENNFVLLHVGNIDNISKVIRENPIIKDKIEYVELKGSLCVCHSTDIRKSIAQGIGLEKGLLNDSVLEYINQNNLYK